MVLALTDSPFDRAMARMSLGQTIHHRAGQLDTTSRIESLLKGRPDMRDSHDPRIDGLAIVDTAISADKSTREDVLISAVQGGKETRVRHRRGGCWWYEHIKVQCLHKIPLPLLMLTLSINKKQGQQLFLHIQRQGEGQHPRNQGQRLVSHLTEASRGFKTCIRSCISVATGLGISEESGQRQIGQ